MAFSAFDVGLQFFVEALVFGFLCDFRLKGGKLVGVPLLFGLVLVVPMQKQPGDDEGREYKDEREG